VLAENPIIRVDLISTEKSGTGRGCGKLKASEVFASQTSRDAISIAHMEDSKISPALVFFVGNYFVTFFIIGLIAAGDIAT
jgi:hypothetical protein